MFCLLFLLGQITRFAVCNPFLQQGCFIKQVSVLKTCPMRGKDAIMRILTKNWKIDKVRLIVKTLSDDEPLRSGLSFNCTPTHNLFSGWKSIQAMFNRPLRQDPRPPVIPGAGVMFCTPSHPWVGIGEQKTPLYCIDSSQPHCKYDSSTRRGDRWPGRAGEMESAHFWDI